MRIEKKEDVIRTAVELVAKAICYSLPENVNTIVVSGGGAFNPTIKLCIEKYSKDLRCVRIDEWEHCIEGLTSSNKEAVAFCVLGIASLLGVPANVPNATGAKQKIVLGKITTNKKII